MSKASKNLSIDSSLYTRISVLAEMQGLTAEELASSVLDEAASEQEAARIEHAHLQKRWQTYLDTGETVPAEKIRAKLRSYAVEAANRLET